MEDGEHQSYAHIRQLIWLENVEWTFGDDGLVMKSMGHFDDDEYQYQLEHGIE